jgi:signal recognition particle subunit SRP54
MAGLQGSGKTTATGKLARYLREKHNSSVAVAACDVYRPAAVEQLIKVGGEAGAAVYEQGTDRDPVKIAAWALDRAKAEGKDVLIVDTSGRLHVDQALMKELADIKKAISPDHIWLVVDAMTGQDAVNTARAFNERVGVTGIVMTRMDGDARGGAALSMRAVTGAPIKLIGLGEKLDALEEFHPGRVAGRILDMGDVVGLVERAAEVVEQEEAEKLAKKIARGKFDLEDYAKQLQQITRMGSVQGLISMLPGAGKLAKQIEDANIDKVMLKRQAAIISSMTPAERRNPDMLKASRKRRIAAGSGTSAQDVNRLLKQFDDMSTMMKRMTKLGQKGLARAGIGALLGGRRF